MSQLEDHIIKLGFELKQERTTTYQWAAILREAWQDLSSHKEGLGLRCAIDLLTEVLSRGIKLAVSPKQHRGAISLTNGTIQLFWIHAIRIRLDENYKSSFPVNRPQALNAWLSGKIQLLEHAQRDPREYGSRAIEFIDAWLVELEAHHTSLIR